MMIDFLYFEGCPNSDASLAKLRAALDELRAGAEPRLVLVSSREEAARLGFLGSPSVRVDGHDLATGEAGGETAFSCRVYKIEGRRTGLLTKAYILERLRSLV